MDIDLNISLFNFRDGGLKPDGCYDFRPLFDAYYAGPAPDLIALCFTDRWGRSKPLTWAFAQLTCSRRHRWWWRPGVNGSGEARVGASVSALCGAGAR